MCAQIRFRGIKRKWQQWTAKMEVEARWFEGGSGRPHGLPQPLIVSLTSHPARFSTLAQTLKGILRQTVRPDATILWISREDFSQLPSEVLHFEKFGLEIVQCRNMRSFTKVVPALQAYPDSFIVTLDDDVYYGEDHIEKLISVHQQHAPRIVCHRAHRVQLTPSGHPLPYKDWERTSREELVSAYALPTGVMGILYPPNVFHEEVCDQKIFSRLCATADDIWLYWMWRLTGHVAHKISGERRIVEWPASQSVNLRAHNNTRGGNDICIANMVRRYGWPAGSQEQGLVRAFRSSP